MPDPLFINASAGAPAYSAGELRRGLLLPMMYGGRNMGARPGVRPGGNQLQVSLAGSTITVQPGVAYIDPALSTAQAGYYVALDAAATHALTAAHATLPRKDIVIARVYDHDEDASGQRTAQTEYLAGVANASPAEPAVPAGAFRLATLDVPASGGGSAVVTNNAPFTVAAGGILPVAAAADLAAGVEGRYRDRLDTNLLERDSGAVWETAADPAAFKAWTPYTPVITGLTGHVATGETLAGFHKIVGKTMHIRWSWTVGTGAVGTGLSIGFDLPTAALAPNGLTCVLMDADVSRRYNGTIELVGGGSSGTAQRISFGSNSGTFGVATPITLAPGDRFVAWGTLELS